MRSRCSWDTEGGNRRKDADDERCRSVPYDGRVELSPHIDSREEESLTDKECTLDPDNPPKAANITRAPSAVIEVCAISSPDMCLKPSQHLGRPLSALATLIPCNVSILFPEKSIRDADVSEAISA